MAVVAAPAQRAPARPGTRLRVAHVNANFCAGSGGITLREALALDADRFSATILAPADGSLFERAEAGGLGVVRLRSMGGGRHVYPWRDAEAVRELAARLRAGGFDVVHTHAGRAGAIGRVAARRVGVRAVVHTLHGFPFNEFQSPPTRLALRAVERRLARLTDYFLTDGTFVASEAVRQRIAPPDRIRALISPIDPVPVVDAPARMRARRALGLPERALVIGTAARLAVQKSPADMVRAFAALARRDVYFAWLGDGELRGETERLIARLGVEDRFLLLGERRDAGRLLGAFDVCAMSSLWEGLPCTVVEAMSCGIPVVATAVNSVPEVVISGRTGLLARPADPASLSRALAYMLDRPTEAARMAAAARRHIGEACSAAALGRELEDVYETAIRLAEGR